MTPCVPWPGHIDSRGYGRKYVGRGRGSGGCMRAHRWTWEQHNGPIPAGMCVLHRCDNPPCVRLEHLFLGTQGDNNRDRHLKDRDYHNSGERNGRARVTEADVRAIRQACDEGHLTQAALARQFGVAPTTISAIVSRQNWAWLA